MRFIKSCQTPFRGVALEGDTQTCGYRRESTCFLVVLAVAA